MSRTHPGPSGPHQPPPPPQPSRPPTPITDPPLRNINTAAPRLAAWARYAEQGRVTW